MKALFMLVIAGLALPNLLAQETQADMEALMKAAAPGPEHSRLNDLVGEWTTVQKMWMAPGTEPMQTTGSTKTESILGGRFVITNDKGLAMGQPYEGMAIIGYDNFRKQYTMSWRSTMETAVTFGTGTYDEETKTISFKGTMIMMGQEVEYRFDSKMVDKDHVTDTMYVNMGGQEVKMMEIASTRVK